MPIKGVIAILSADTDITDIVGVNGVVALQIGQTLPSPSVVVELEGAEPNDCKGTTSMMDEVKVLVSAHSETYLEALDLTNLIRTALDGFTGSIASVEFQHIRFDTMSDGYYEASELYSLTSFYFAHVHLNGNTSNYPPGVNDPVAYSNSDASYSGDAPSGSTLNIGDSTVSNSDDSYSVDVPATIPLDLPDITIENSDRSISISHPAVIDYDIPDTEIRREDWDGTQNTMLTIADHPSGGPYYIPRIAVLDEDDAIVGYVAALQNVKILSQVDTVTQGTGQIAITPEGAAPSGIAYPFPYPAVATESHSDYDTFWHVNNNTFAITSPEYPTHIASLSGKAQQSAVRGTPATGTSSTDAVYPTILTDNNAFGNKFRFTDDQGNESDATIGSDIWAHVNWKDHSWTDATPEYVIDHLTGIGMVVQGITDGTAVNTSTGTDGQSWEDWATAVNSYTLSITGGGTYEDFFLPFVGIGGAFNAFFLYEVWSRNFFTRHDNTARCCGLTGDTAINTSTNCHIFLDSANDYNLTIENTKAQSTSFYDVINSIFPCRVDMR